MGQLFMKTRFALLCLFILVLAFQAHAWVVQPATPYKVSQTSKSNAVPRANINGTLDIDWIDGIDRNATTGGFSVNGDGIVSVNNISVTNSTISNSAAEEVLYNFDIPANQEYVGQAFQIFASGVVSNNSASDDFTFSTYIGSTQIESFHPAIGNVSNADWHFQGIFTIRAVGVSGKIAYHLQTNIQGESSSYEDLENGIATVDLTADEDIELRVQWDNAKVDNVLTGLQPLRYRLH